MQVTKYHLNKHSVDGSTQALYKDCIQKKAKQVRWNGVKELEQRELRLIRNEMCRGQTDLGSRFQKDSEAHHGYEASATSTQTKPN